MGYNKWSFIGFCIPILVLIAGAHAFEKIDETLYLFLASHFVPPPECPDNEMYSMCLGDCPSDCTTRGVCRYIGCPRKGCECRQHFARMTPEGPCEPVHGCPKLECGENESFRECGPVCDACDGVRCRLLTCEHRCYCAEGYLRNKEGKCVPEDQCPPKRHCHRDEELKPSGRKNEYCLRDEDEASNATETKERCYCKEGFSRNTLGYCVAEKFCAMTHCLLGEVYQSCPKKCDATCRTYGDASCEEDGQCFPGCFCPEGKFMDDYQKCVTLEDCPPGSNPFARTAGPTSTPAMTSSGATSSTDHDASGSTPATTDTTDDKCGSTTELSADEEGMESSTAASTTAAATSQATARDGTETTLMSDELKDQTTDIPEDRATDEPKESKPKDQEGDSTEDESTDSEQEQDADSEKDQNMKDQAADTTKEKSADIPKDQVLDELKGRKPKDQASDSVKNQSADSPKDEAANKTKEPEADQSEASTKALVQQDDEDEDESEKEIQEITTVQPKSSKKPGKEKKEPTKARKETEPMDEENE